MGKMFICNQMLQQRISDNKGLSLVAVVIVMLIAASLALVLASFMSSGNIAAITDMQSEQAFYIGQAGMEWYLEQLQNDNNWNSAPAVKTNQAFGAGTFTITYSSNSKDAINIVGTGKVNAWDGNTVQRVISCHVARGTPLVISLWQESL